MDGRRQQAGTVARRNRQARWYALVVYVLLPLVAWGAVGLAAVTRRYVPPDTGDPLTDAVLDVLLSEYLSNPELLEERDTSANGRYSFDFTLINSEYGAGISSLYEEFASDPRYWQALAFLGAYPKTNQYYVEQVGSYRKEIWEQALAHGATDSQLRQLKLANDAGLYYWDAYLASQNGKLQGNSLTSDEQIKVFDMPSGYVGSVVIERQRAKQEQEQRQLTQLHVDTLYPELEAQLTELRELDGDECYPWYASSCTAFWRGDYELAKFFLQRGNEAENVLRRTWFLSDKAVDLVSSGETTVGGFLFYTNAGLHLMNVPYDQMALEAVVRQDGEMLDALLEYAWRWELSPYPRFVSQYSTIARYINRKFERQVKPIASEKYSSFKRQLDSFDALCTVESQLEKSKRPVSSLKNITWANAMQVVRDRLAFNESKRWHYLGYLAGKVQIEAQFQQQRAAIVREMQGFSYQELGWPEDAAPAPADGGAGEAAVASDENATAGDGDAPAAAGGDA